MGRLATRALGATDDVAAEIDADVRRRDAERLDLEIAGGIHAGVSRILGNAGKTS